MDHRICFDKTIFIILIILIVIVSFFLIKTTIKSSQPTTNIIIKEKEEIRENPWDRMTNIVRRHDRRVVMDPLMRPEKRLDRYLYGDTNNPIFGLVEQPTRGYPDDFSYYGLLINGDKKLKLFGRQTYPGSSQYDYYGISEDLTSQIKVNIKDHNEKRNIRWRFC